MSTPASAGPYPGAAGAVKDLAGVPHRAAAEPPADVAPLAAAEDLAAVVRRIEQRVDEHDQLLDVAAGSAEAAVTGTLYPDLETWVREHFLPMYPRRVGIGSALRWCVQWWQHAEAISRLEATWRAWEAARLNPNTGMASWYRDVLDPMLGQLLADTGPFAGCAPGSDGKPARHVDPVVLPADPAPAGWWGPPPAEPADADQPDQPAPAPPDAAAEPEPAPP